MYVVKRQIRQKMEIKREAVKKKRQANDNTNEEKIQSISFISG